MPTITVEINDIIPDLIEEAKEALKEVLRDFLKENPDFDEVPCVPNDLDYSGEVHERIDSIALQAENYQDDIFYLRGGEITKLFVIQFGSEAVAQDGWPMGWRLAAIYTWIDQEAREWYQENGESLVEEIRKELGLSSDEDDEGDS